MNEEDGRTKQDLIFEVNKLDSQLSDEIIKNEKLQQENEELKQRFYKTIHEIQLIQMDGEVSVRDITKLVGTLKGDK